MAKIICETGASHQRSYSRSVALINVARMAGADAVKFSAFKPDEMTANSKDDPFVIKDDPWQGKSLYELYEQSALSYEFISDLRATTVAAGMEFVLSVYHPNTVPLLKDWGVHTVKIASFENTYIDLLEAISAQKHIKHVILSAGGATVEEIETALSILDNLNVTLLHCVSSYPTDPEDMNLLTMLDMKDRFNVPVGLSDHSMGFTAAVAATAMGGEVIEKHIKLDDEGLDSSFAVFPDRFACMVAACREVEKVLGEASYPGVKSYHRCEIDGRFLRKVW